MTVPEDYGEARATPGRANAGMDAKSGGFVYGESRRSEGRLSLRPAMARRLAGVVGLEGSRRRLRGFRDCGNAVQRARPVSIGGNTSGVPGRPCRARLGDNLNSRCGDSW